MAADILLTLNELVGKLTDLITVQNSIAVQQSLSVSIDCGCNVGKGPDNGEGEEGGGIPDPIGDIVYDEPAPIDERKCKAADYLAHWIVFDIFQNILIAHNIKELAGIGLVLALGIVGSLIGLTTGPAGGVVGGVAGLIIGAISALIGTEIDIDLSQEVMEDQIQNLICALYEATTTTQARDDFEQVLIDDGQLSTAEIAFIKLWLPNALLNVLFFDITSPFDSAVFFDGYDPVVGCDACDAVALDQWTFLRSGEFGGRTGPTELGTGVIDNGGGSFTISSVPGFISGTPTNVLGIITEGFRQSQVGDTSMLTLPSGTAGGTLNVTVYPSPGPSRDGRRCDTCGAAITIENIGGTGVVTGRQMAVWHRSTPFSITLQVTVPPSICP